SQPVPDSNSARPISSEVTNMSFSLQVSALRAHAACQAYGILPRPRSLRNLSKVPFDEGAIHATVGVGS
ncbi:MAG: hypothetical protein ACE1ZA_17660, partial [Pseudomonadales bacterium]